MFSLPQSVKRVPIHTLMCGLTALALLLYTTLRAFLLPITHDEAYSYTAFVGMDVLDIISYKDTNGIPNNHIFNTLMMKLSEFLFGLSAFTLRIPVVLAHLVFLISTAVLSRRITPPALAIAFFFAINANPYLLDFFALARGYGYSLTFLALSCLYFFRWSDQPTRVSYLPALLFGALAILSNFTLLHFFFALLAGILMVYVREEKTFRFSHFIRFFRNGFILILMTAIVLYEPFRCIIKWKQTFGGQTGFWTDTVGGILWESFHEADYNFEVYPIALYCIQGIMLLLGAWMILKIVRLGSEAFRSDAMLWILLCILSAASSVMQHVLLGTEFLIARTGLFLYPLFIAACFFSVKEVAFSVRSRSVLGLAFSSLLTIHCLLNMQLTHVPEWKYDASTYSVFHVLEHTSGTRPIHLGIHWIFEPGMNFHRKAEQLNWIEPLTRDGISGEYDYYYVQSPDTLNLRIRGKQILQHFPVSETFLLH